MHKKYKLVYSLNGAEKKTVLEDDSIVPLREIADNFTQGEEWEIRNIGNVLMESSKDKKVLPQSGV